MRTNSAVFLLAAFLCAAWGCDFFFHKFITMIFSASLLLIRLLVSNICFENWLIFSEYSTSVKDSLVLVLVGVFRLGSHHLKLFDSGSIHWQNGGLRKWLGTISSVPICLHLHFDWQVLLADASAHLIVFKKWPLQKIPDKAQFVHNNEIKTTSDSNVPKKRFIYWFLNDSLCIRSTSRLKFEHVITSRIRACFSQYKLFFFCYYW